MEKWMGRNKGKVQIFAYLIFMGMIFGLMKSCESNVTINNYEGFENACEISGGVFHDKKCFKPDALISPEYEVQIKESDQ